MPNQRYVGLMALIAALGGFLMGFDASVISGVVKFIESQFSLSAIDLGWAVSSLTLTATIAMMVAGPLSDKIGRKKVLSLSAVLYAVSAIASAYAPSYWFLVVARMIGGFGVGASLIVAPMYIAEIAPAKVRGRMVSFNQLNIVIGISAAFFSNFLILKLAQAESPWAQALKFDEYQWRWMLGVETLPAILYYVFLFIVPESPRWLMMHRRDSEALAILERASGPTNAHRELEDIKANIAAEAHREQVPIAELFAPAMRLVLTIGIVIAVIQQMTGINAVFFYAPMIFEQSGIGTDASFSQAIWVGLTNLLFTIVAMGLIDRAGRKPLLAFGLAGITLSMGLLAYGFSSARYTLSDAAVAELPVEFATDDLQPLLGKTFENDVAFKQSAAGCRRVRTRYTKYSSELIKASIKLNPKLILIGILGFVACFAMSLGPVMWVLFSELFPNRIRGLAISFVGFINSGVSFLVQFFFPWSLANLGSALTFLTFGGFAAIGFVLIMWLLPETKGRSLEELSSQLVKDSHNEGTVRK